MGIEWLKRLMGPTDQMIPPGQPTPLYTSLGAVPPEGAAPVATAPVATPSGELPAPAPAGADAAVVPTREERIAALEARCDELHRNLESVGQFARTLLVLLEEKKLATSDEFQETLRRGAN